MNRSELPLPASQVSSRVLFQKAEHKGSRQKLQMEPEVSHMLPRVRGVKDNLVELCWT